MLHRISVGVAAALCVAASLGLAGCRPGSAHATVLQPTSTSIAQFPYRGKTFESFVSESYTYCKAQNAESFKDWMKRAYAAYRAQVVPTAPETLDAFLDAKRKEIGSIVDPKERAKAEQALGESLWKFVKVNVRTFSLVRGFEYAYTVQYNERQCYSQSVLICSLLQDAGVRSGVMMIGRNSKGQETNLGHAVALLKLSDGTDVVIDASETEPVWNHKGVFARVDADRFMEPKYDPTTMRISAYRLLSTGRTVSPSEVSPLSLDYVKSQFWYYRGERAPFALQSKRPRLKGLQTAESALRQSVSLYGRNPLAVYMLAKTELMLGNENEARNQIGQAMNLYRDAGWTPNEVRQLAARLGADRPQRVLLQ